MPPPHRDRQDVRRKDQPEPVKKGEEAADERALIVVNFGAEINGRSEWAEKQEPSQGPQQRLRQINTSMIWAAS